MNEKMQTVRYDPDKKRKPGVQVSLDTVAHQRKGDGLIILIMGETGRTMPIPVKNCRHCGDPAPMIDNTGQHGGKFLCRECVIIFG